MAKYFLENNIKACAVYSGEGSEFSMERKEALGKLNTGEINVIFSVDMFNEGIDVPAVDLVMFLSESLCNIDSYFCTIIFL